MILLDVTKHACDRAKERFGIDPNQAKFILNKALNEAQYLHDGENDTKLYLSENDIVLVVSKKENKIITCYSRGEVPVVLTETIRDEKIKNEIKLLFEKRFEEIDLASYELEKEKLEVDLELADIKLKIKKKELSDNEINRKHLNRRMEYADSVTQKRNKNNRDRSNLVNDFSFILNEDLKKYMKLFRE